MVLWSFGWGAVDFARSAHIAGSTSASPERHVREPARILYHAGGARTHGGVRQTKRRVPYRIAFFGDSVTVGFGASNRRTNYVSRVVSWLRARGNRVIESIHAKGGVPVAYWMDAPMPKRLNAAVVELGTNDVRLGTPAAQFAREYRTLTKRIRRADPKTQVLCLSVWPHVQRSSLDRTINAQIRAVCPGTYVDVTALRYHAHIRSVDGFHPNNLGYLLIARAVESKLNRR